MKFPSIKTAKVLDAKDLASISGGIANKCSDGCRNSCKTSCQTACSPGGMTGSPPKKL